MIVLDDPDALAVWLEGREHLRGAVLQGLDLRGLGGRIGAFPAEGALFLGCELDPRLAEHIVSTGGILFPALPDMPFQPYRLRLYSSDELMEGYVHGRPGSYAETLDARIWAWFERICHAVPGPGDLLDVLAMRLHDHAIDLALFNLLESRDPPRIIGVMGGHGLGRDEPAYREVARLGAMLAREGFLVATGGGPGAMEAALLGSWMAEVLGEIRAVPSWRDPA
jgi:hypothetical protein